MQIMYGNNDSATLYEPGTGSTPDYEHDNPVEFLTDHWARQRQHLAASQDYYEGHSIQVLLPYSGLELHGPSGDDWNTPDPLDQLNKEDFQKQNIKNITLADTALVRGWAKIDNQRVPFIRFCYRAGPFSTLAQALGSVPGATIGLWAQVGQRPFPQIRDVPYDVDADCYALEVWGFSGDLRAHLDARGQNRFDLGILVADPALLSGSTDFLDPPTMTDLTQVAADHPMHPINKLHCQVAWCNSDRSVWDSRNGLNHQYRFQMLQRGWDKHLQRGISANPHGGIGFLEFRNLFSEYFGFKRSAKGIPSGQPVEIGRLLEPWNLDAFGQPAGSARTEDFLVVRFMDLCSVNAKAAIGLHRHRDNQEVFFILDGEALCFLGDWAEYDDRERAVEVRHLTKGDTFPLKNGQLHALVNLLDTPCTILVFGAYD